MEAYNEKQREIDSSTKEINYYNSLKTIVDNCSFEVEVDEDGLVRDKTISLPKLYGVLMDGKL